MMRETNYLQVQQSDPNIQSEMRSTEQFKNLVNLKDQQKIPTSKNLPLSKYVINRIANENISPNLQPTTMNVRLLAFGFVQILFISFGIFLIVALDEIYYGVSCMFVALLSSWIYCIFSQTPRRLKNIKSFSKCKQVYQKMISGNAYFQFEVVCTNGEDAFQVVSSQNYYPVLSIDQSRSLNGIENYDLKKYVFLKCQKQFLFENEQSYLKFQSAFLKFKQRNEVHCLNEIRYSFQVEDFEEQITFCNSQEGNLVICRTAYYLCATFGLLLLYECIMERFVSRYNIKIVKKIAFN